MRATSIQWLVVAALAACGARQQTVSLTGDWPATAGDYDDVVSEWTRKGELRADYQEVCELTATLKSSAWRAAHAVRLAENRGLVGEAKAQLLQQAQADAVSAPYELEIMLTTWDRRENDIDRGKKSSWRVVLIDEAGHEIEPLEIVKDRRPVFVVRAEFPAFGEFATPYIARFPRTTPIFGPKAKQVRLRMSSPRGGVEVTWDAP